MVKKKFKPQPKKNYVEYKPCRGPWTKAELISVDKLNRAKLRLISGEIIHHTTLKGFHWGIIKKKKKKVVPNG